MHQKGLLARSSGVPFGSVIISAAPPSAVAHHTLWNWKPFWGALTEDMAMMMSDVLSS